MKINFDIIRRICISIQESPSEYVTMVYSSSFTTDAFNAHLKLAHEVKFIEGELKYEDNKLVSYELRLTALGQDFANKTKDEYIWFDFKRFMKQCSLEIPVFMINDLLSEYIKPYYANNFIFNYSLHNLS